MMRVLLALELTGCVSSETTAGGDCGDAGLGEACAAPAAERPTSAHSRASCPASRS